MSTCPKILQSNTIRKDQRALHFSLPIGVFWDIETCGVPRGKSASAFVQNIREKFFVNHREIEFVCVCDARKLSRNVIGELILAQVTVVHVSGIQKSEACDKLKQYMKRTVDKQNGAPSTLLLISENVDFYSQLSDFRHCNESRIILIHCGHAHQSLLACADEHYEFSAIASDIPSKISHQLPGTRLNLLLVSNLPRNLNVGWLICTLKKLSFNCGGRVFKVNGKHKAVIHFATLDAAVKAQKQMHKQRVYGKEISVTFYCGIESDFVVQTPRSISSSKRLSSYSTRRGKDAFKTHTRDLSCSKFNSPPIVPLMYNRTDNLNESIPSFVSTGFEEPSLHSLCHPENLPLDMKASVSKNFDSINFGTPPVCARNSLLDSKAAEEELLFSDHTQRLRISAGETPLNNTDQGSFSKSSAHAHIIPTFEVSSEFSQKSPSVSSDENRNFNPEGEMPICSKNDSSKKCFPHDPSKFEMKQGTKFERRPIGLLEVSHHAQPADRDLNISSEYKDQDHVPVESTKSTQLTGERKRNRQVRIAARFTNPIHD